LAERAGGFKNGGVVTVVARGLNPDLYPHLLPRLITAAVADSSGLNHHATVDRISAKLRVNPPPRRPGSLAAEMWAKIRV